MQERREADGSHLAGYLRDADGAAELIGRLPAGDNAADVSERALDHEPGFADAHGERFTEAVTFGDDICRCRRARDAEHADAVNVAEVILDLLQLRRGGERQALANAIDLDLERHARRGPHH